MVDLRFPGKFPLFWAGLTWHGFQSSGHHADSPHCNTLHVAGDLVTFPARPVIFPAKFPIGNPVENSPGNWKSSQGTYTAIGAVFDVTDESGPLLRPDGKACTVRVY